MQFSTTLESASYQKKTKTTPYDTADYLKTEEDRALYFEACLDEAGDDPAFIAKALGDIAHAHGMTQLARDTGLALEGQQSTRTHIATGQPDLIKKKSSFTPCSTQADICCQG
jgi:probable addiction module antidote protein